MLKRLIFLFGLALVAIVAHAQKLPNVQTNAIFSPANIKIDGSASEWGDKYSAYNKNVEFFYTLANDDENLYLVVHAIKSRIIEKIIEGGVSFTVNSSGKKDDLKKTVVLFPLMPLSFCKGTLVAAGKSLTGKTMTNDHQDLTQSLNQEAHEKSANSMSKANEELIANMKEIKVSGMDAVIDTIANVNEKTPYYRTLPLRSHSFKIIPKDNQDNIKAIVQFDDKGELTYELQIPLRYINNLQTKGNTFFYNVTINGRGEDGRPGNTITFSPPPNQTVLDQDLEEPTDFSGEYTLAKKP